jgi:hypothetical protein
MLFKKSATVPKKKDAASSHLRPLIGAALLSCAVAWLMGHLDYKLSWAFAAVFVGLPFVFFAFTFPRFGLMTALGLSYFIFFIKRLVYNYELPVGLVVEVLLITSAVGVLVRSFLHDEMRPDWYKNKITVMVVLWIAYLLLQAVNPSMTSMNGWQLAFRGIISFIATYYVSFYAFNSLKFVRDFTWLWVGLAAFAAAYGIYQEMVGLPPWDLKWVTSSPTLFALNFIQGKFRKFSILGNVSAQGIFMAYAAIFCLIMMMGPFKAKIRIYMAISAVLMLLAMAFSGTRTAYAQVPAGIALYVLMTINNRRTLMLAMGAMAVFVFILFGPIYTPQIIRIRSAFFPSEDSSMQVRDKNRGRIQPYIWTHPIGGGIGTSGEHGREHAPNHELAGFPPDSGYLEVAVEMGWIGLLLNMAVKFVILFTGVHFFYRCKDPEVKILYAAYICSFFSITVAHFAQVATGQLPNGMIYNCTYVILIKLIEFDRSDQSSSYFSS